MVEAYREEQAKGEERVFELGQEVTVHELRRIVAPQNTRDPVEERRLMIVSGHVGELLRGDLSPQEVDLHKNCIHNLGAEAVLGYLPASETA